MNSRLAFRASWMALFIGALLSAGCRRAQPPGAGTRPADESPATAPQTAPETDERPDRESTRPATAPATRPEELLPESTFSTEPPYTVQLYVRKPEQKQPGWLKVLEMDNKNAIARARGVFPRQNIMEVETDNIRRIQLEMGYLPLGEGKRVILRIDKQGIEITQSDRRYITLERRPTGEWVVERPR